MILHDFTYEWDGKSRDGEKPITWFPGAYKVRIVRLADEDTDIHYLFPVAVMLKPILKKDSGYQALKNYIHNFAEKLSIDYDLDIHKTMWVEIRNTIRIAHLNPDRQLKDLTLFSYTWREARPNEMEMIFPFLENF
jgi:hypothetical protein